MNYLTRLTMLGINPNTRSLWETSIEDTSLKLRARKTSLSTMSGPDWTYNKPLVDKYRPPAGLDIAPVGFTRRELDRVSSL